MRKSLLFSMLMLSMVALAMLAAGCGETGQGTAKDTTPGAGGKGSVAVTNGSSSYQIVELYITPSANATWGDNLITSPISPGSTRTITDVPEGMTDLLAVFSNSSEYEQYDFTVTSGQTYQVTATSSSTTTPQPSTGTTGSITGRVIDALTRQAVANATYTVKQGTTTVTSGTTDATGSYEATVSAGTGYSLTTAKTGYAQVVYSNVSVEAGGSAYVEDIPQISNTYATGSGTISGTISNAFDGTGIAGVAIQLRAGMNTTSGTALPTTATTNSTGSYTFSGLAWGNYTAEVTGTGYASAFFNVVCLGNTTVSNQNMAITPSLSTGQTRIVLTWGASPDDLDAHLTGPASAGGRFHIYFMDQSYYSGSSLHADLDWDDMSSYGPETVTIYTQATGMYRYSVLDYSNEPSTTSTALSNSGAQVKVYRANQPTLTYNVPSNRVGTLWTVFEMNGSTITPVNTMTSPTGGSSSIQTIGIRAALTDGDFMMNLPRK